MASMRTAAQESYREKMGRMGLVSGGDKGEVISTASMGEEVGEGHTGSKKDGSLGMNSGSRAVGYATEEDNEKTMAEKAGKKRLDRPAYKNGGRVRKAGTTVNVIVASAPPKPEAPPMPMPGPPMGGPPPMPMPPPDAAGPPPLPPPGLMGRKSGGRVPHLTGSAGAGGAKGRLAKIKSYGDNARK